jgi:surfeit locus 1 family protein
MRPSLRNALIAVAALLAAAALARLGVWQLDRAAQKMELQSARRSQGLLPALPQSELAHDAAAAALQSQRMTVLRGRWRSELTVYLENRQMQGRPGFYALTPLQLDDGSAVLVQRGWLPRDPADRTHIVAPPAPGGAVEVEGTVAPEPSRLFEFAGAASGPIRQNVDVHAYALESGLALRPFIVVQRDSPSASADGLLRQWPEPAVDVHRNYGYAVQWFSLCALVIGLYAWFQLIRPRRA